MINIRPALFSDHIAIAQLHALSWQQNYRGILSDHFLDNEVEKDRLDTWYQRLKFADENQIVLVAIQNDIITGLACVFLDHDPAFGSLLDNLHVAKNARQSGVGKMLIKNCATAIFDKAKNKKMYLWVYESNQNARIAYEYMGATHFETTDTTNDDGTVAKTCRYVWDDVSKLV